LILVFWSAVGAAVGFAIGNSKGRGEVGAVLGLFFGALGWIIVLLLPSTPEAEATRLLQVSSAVQGVTNAGSLPGMPSQRPCPWCAEPILPAAIVCRFCGRDVDPIASASAPVDNSNPVARARPDEATELKDGSLKCPYCKRTFVTRDRLDSHLQAFHPTEVARSKRASDPPIQQLMPVVGGDYACDTCTRAFVSPERLESHKNAFHA
jgi:hypothetical protein